VSTDCRNDCAAPLQFPRRPENRAGLAHINYRIGTYADIRAALLHQLNRALNLTDWTHRGADDPGIALLEGAAILGDILTFYQELYANEAYLRTAEWRTSIADLVRLTGYRLAPGLGGSATFAFEVKGDKPVQIPAHFPVKAEVQGLAKPADFETTEAATAYPWLNSFHLYGAYAAPKIIPVGSKFSGPTREFFIFAPNQYTAPVELQAGDRLLFGLADSAAKPRLLAEPEIIAVESVRELFGMKLIKLKHGLRLDQPGAEINAYKIGRTFRHFGHNSPLTMTKSDGKNVHEYYHSPGRSLNDVAVSVAPPYTNLRGVTNCIKVIDPGLSQWEWTLDVEAKDLAPLSPIVVQALLYKDETGPGKEFTLVRQIAGLRSLSLTWGNSVGTSTLVTIDDTLDNTPAVKQAGYTFTDIRFMQFHEVLSPLFTLRPALRNVHLSPFIPIFLPGQEPPPEMTEELHFYGTEAQLQTLKGRRLLFNFPDDEPLLATVEAIFTPEAVPTSPTAADPLRPLLRTIKIKPAVDMKYFALEQPTVTVYGNLVDATQGKTEQEVPLGNGDRRLTFQNFKLPKSPLTYLVSAGDAPPVAPELQIYVGGRRWRRVASFFGHGPDEQIYIVREDANNDSWVQFGDGQTGARLPSGVKNVVAHYRTGTGAFGALKPDTKPQAGAKLERLDKVHLPGVAAGGSQPEDAANAREVAPGKLQSLDRLVSLKDFESEAQAIAGVARAAAAWTLYDNVPALVLTVLMQTGRDAELEQVRQVLADYGRCRGAQRFPVIVRAGRRQWVAVIAVVLLDGTRREAEVRADIKQALGANDGAPHNLDLSNGLFSLRARRFGEKEYATKVNGVIQNVAGVQVTKAYLYVATQDASDPATLTYASFQLHDVAACKDDAHVLSLYEGHVYLVFGALPAGEGC
jgi:hypothetical protein